MIRDNLVAALEELVPLKVVGTADDEAGALRWLADPANVCDVAIIDLFLRRGSGVGVLGALRSADVRFDRIVLSNYSSADMRRRCLELGASRVLDKSADIDILIEHCRRLVNTAAAVATGSGRS